MTQSRGDTGPRALPASCPAWAVPWVSEQGSSLPGAMEDELPWGRPWAKATTLKGTALGWHLPSPPPTPYRRLPLLLFQSWACGQSWCLRQAREDPTPHVTEASALRGLLFRNMSRSGNLVLTSVAHRGWHDGGMTPDPALATGLTPPSLRDGSASSLWRDHYTSKSLLPPISHPEHKGAKSEGF